MRPILCYLQNVCRTSSLMQNRTNMRLIETYHENKGRLPDLEELKRASKGELEELKAQVDFDLANMHDQLQDENRRYKRERTSTNQVWYNKLRLAKNAKGHLSQLIQAELGVIKRANDLSNQKEFAERLVRAMDLVLPKEMKEEVLRKAQELLVQIETEQART